MNKYECYNLLGIEQNSDETTIKTAFRKIALKSHPDKVSHLPLIDQQKSEELFKKCSTAYRILTGVEEEEFSPDDFLSQWCDPETINTMKDMFENMATNMFAGNNENNNPLTNFYESLQKKINININIDYSDYFENKILKKIINFNNTHFETDIDCSKYPKISRFIQYNNTEYELVINMLFNISDIYEHKLLKNGSVDIIYNINLTLYHYLTGKKHTIEYLDKSNIDIIIKPCCLKDIKFKNKGILDGKLVVKKHLIHPTINNLKKLSEEEFNTYIILTKKIYI